MGFSTSHIVRGGARLVAAAGLACLFLIPASSEADAVRTVGHAAAHPPVNVLYAGSLEDVMNQSVIPAFDKATGYRVDGFPAGSSDLASDIKGKVRPADVFISASPAVNKKLEGKKNGNWVSWYSEFATSPLVLGYNTSSSFASALKTKPWYQVIDQSGFRLGFTDPAQDPKGVLAVAAMKQAASTYGQPALDTIAADQNDMFPEESLVGDLQSGELDAGFFYTVEASAAKIPTVSLGSIKEHATYTITVVNGAEDAIGGQTFVKFLLGPKGRSLLKAVGLVMSKSFKAVGTNVPTQLGGVIKK
jgi:molybdate/tungstate transport system substrate-binding protein